MVRKSDNKTEATVDDSEQSPLELMEGRFKKFAGLPNEKLACYTIKQSSNQEINKDKSKEFGEVFSPLWLIDSMIDQVTFGYHYAHDEYGIKYRDLNRNYNTLDLCAGYGQFSIRLFRKLSLKFVEFDLDRFMQEQHYFSELQLSSCWKLLHIFEVKINLLIGDATELPKVPKNAKGIWLYVEEAGQWVCLTKTIKRMRLANGPVKKMDTEAHFVKKVETLTAYLNATYKDMKDKMEPNIKALAKDKQGRLEMLKFAKGAVEDVAWQKVVTPCEDPTSKEPEKWNLVDSMIKQVDDLEHKRILVLFNCEILEELIHANKIPAGNITFATDAADEAEAKFVKALYGVDCFTFGDEIKDGDVAAFLGKKYSLVLSNPPYTKGIDLKILQALIGASIAKEYVVVHPSTWLLTTCDSPFRNSVANILKGVTFFNANIVFKGIELAVPGVITHISLDHNSPKCLVEYRDELGEKFLADNISDITKFGKDWTTVVRPFSRAMQEQVAIGGNIVSHKVYEVKDGKYYCQSARQRGHVVINDPKRLVEDDFYTFWMNDNNDNKGVRLSLGKIKGNCAPTFEFDTEVERDNFFDYMKTDFVRFCLALAKNNINMDDSVLKLIPWLDFTQSWDDEKLFAHFNIDQAMQDYIRSFLPTYYGIRKNEQTA